MRWLLVAGVAIVLAAVESNVLPVRHPKWGLVGPPRPPVVNVKLPGDSWFTQQLDHFDSSETRTWLQRYFVSQEFYQDGGPAFLMIGGEGEASASWMAGGQWITPAVKHGAMLFQLEHRYYGDSQPTPLTQDNLKYLSSEQALSDLAAFQKAMIKQYGLGSTKWIIFGCSYSGNLAAWYRYLYPDLAYASMAGSAPVVAEVDYYQYYEVISTSLESIKQGCGSLVGQAIKAVNSYMGSDSGKDYLSKLFNTCEPLSSPGYDYEGFYSGLALPFAFYVQYYDSTSDTYCDDIVDGQGTPIENLSNVIYKYHKGGCMVTEKKQKSGRVEGLDAWMFQTCSEFGYFMTADSDPNNIFNGFDLDYVISGCRYDFGPNYSKDNVYRYVNATNKYYKGRSVPVTRVVFPNGALDPWAALGIKTDLNPDSPAITIENSAHCAIYDNEGGSNPSLNDAQAKVDALIDQWLSE